MTSHHDVVARLRATLGGIAQEECCGDNLTILLASYFEPGIESEELDDCGTWKQGAIDACDKVLDAIHAHYTPLLESQAKALSEAEAERDAWRNRESETQEALQAIGDEFGVYGGEPRTHGIRRVLTEMRAFRAEAMKVIEPLLNAKALAGVRALVAGWNGEGRDEPYKERHPYRLGATLPTCCGEVYELDEALTAARAFTNAAKEKT
jgi:hypothetical protein